METSNHEHLLSALNAIPAAGVSYQEWTNVGMILKAEGLPCSVWEAWSAKDPVRYHPGECERKWASFGSSGLGGGSLIRMAQEYGFETHSDAHTLGWDDEIEFDGASPAAEWHPAQQLRRYLQLLFEPDDFVSFVTDSRLDDDGKRKPASAGSCKTAAQLLSDLDRYGDDLGWSIGDYAPEAGAWIRFNPTDGRGVGNGNITAFRYALVESDTLSIPEQEALYRRAQLPIAALVHSGGKSLHAIVKVDAPDAAEYRKRVAFLYDYLKKAGAEVDLQNSNPSRLSRMPGVMRGGNRQYLVAEQIGRKSWADWVAFVEGSAEEDLPETVDFTDFIDKPANLKPEIIEGVLRQSHKMLLSAASKAGKSVALMELCDAFATGTEWLGFRCKAVPVLYINLEIDDESCMERFRQIHRARRTPSIAPGMLKVLSLRGRACPLDKLVPRLIERIRAMAIPFGAIIVDPIYKVLTGDENSASDMAYFCNQFDRLAREIGASVIYCHHHSKGSQGAKRAMDRASGSGVFARDPDAQLDLIELELHRDYSDAHAPFATAWQLEGSLREFAPFKPKKLWFEYPVHHLDDFGELADAHPAGSFENVRAKNPKCTTEEERRGSIEMAYAACSFGGNMVTVKAMAEYLGCDEKTVRSRIHEDGSGFEYKNGIVRPTEQCG